MAESILRLADVEAMIGLKATRIYELMAAGDFPSAVRVSTRAVGWLSSEVDAWIAARAAGPRVVSRQVRRRAFGRASVKQPQ